MQIFCGCWLEGGKKLLQFRGQNHETCNFAAVLNPHFYECRSSFNISDVTVLAKRLYHTQLCGLCTGKQLSL